MSDLAALRLFTVDEVAEILGVGKTLASRLINSGRIPSIKFGRVRRVRRDDLEGFVACYRIPKI